MFMGVVGGGGGGGGGGDLRLLFVQANKEAEHIKFWFKTNQLYCCFR